jgi:Outer membrane protein beta-barrel domain
MDMENRFDDILKNKIKDFELPYDHQSWELLQDKMVSAQSMAENKFDYTIKSKLHNNTEGGVDWGHFEKILDTQKKLSNNLFKTKIAEFSLLAIFLMTAWSFNFSSIHNNQGIEKNKANRIPLEQSKPNTNKSVNKNYAYNATKGSDKLFSNSKDDFSGSSNVLKNNNLELRIAPNDFNNATQADNVDLANTSANANQINTILEVKQKSTQDVMYPIQTLLPNIISYTKDNMLGIVKPIFDSPAQKSKFKIGLYTGINMYDVTSEIRSKNVNSGTSEDKTSGYTLGATIAYSKGNIAIESGLGYSNINYVPLQVEENPVFTIKELATIKTHTVQLPLNFKYYLTQNSTIKTYLTAGASLNIALFANYNRDQELNPNVKNTYNEGLLVDGKWKDNYFFTTNIGLGIEYKINGYLSAFLQPTAMLHTGSNALGAYNDRINTFALKTGLKFNL